MMKKYIPLLAGLLLLANVVHAQQVGPKLSMRGQAPADFPQPTYAERMDLNYDASPDIVTLQENSQGTTTGLKIVDTASRSTVISLSQAQITELFGVGQLRVLGFVDLNGDGARELSVLKRSPYTGKKAGTRSLYAEYSPKAGLQPESDSLFVLDILGDALAISQVFPERDTGHQKATDIQRLSTFGLSDLDNDGNLDLMLGDDEAGIVEIWGATPSQSADVSKVGLMEDGDGLSQNFPNPFSGTTAITYQVTENAPVQLRIYDMLGREVRSLINQSQPPGVHTVEWDGRDESGHVVSAGVYLYKLQIGDFTSSRQMTRVK